VILFGCVLSTLCRLELRTRYTQDRPGGSVSFGYLQDSANQWRKLLYIFGSKVAICVGDEFDQYESNYVYQSCSQGYRVRAIGMCSLGYWPAYNHSSYTHGPPALRITSALESRYGYCTGAEFHHVWHSGHRNCVNPHAIVTNHVVIVGDSQGSVVIVVV